MQLILFDFDGVLADTLSDMIQFAQEACDELDVHHAVIPTDLSNLEVMSFATFGKACEVPNALIDEFVRTCTGKFAKKKVPPSIFAGIPNVIRELSRENILAIVTGNTAENVNSFLVHHGLLSCFSMVYGVDMPGSKVEKIKMAWEQFKTDNKSVFFIGDSLSDIQSAREANVISVAVSWGHQNLEMLARGKPDAIIHSPMELLEVLNSR